MVTEILLAILILSNVIFFIILLNWKRLVSIIYHMMMKRILSDAYDENVAELFPGTKRFGLLTIIENSLRAEGGNVLHRPMGSPRNWPNFETITFIPAQTFPFPTSNETDIDVSITIGPKAKKPLHLKIPLLISGMGYGVGLSEKSKIALAQAATKAGTAINSGEGGILPEEVEAAENFILQFSKTSWGKDEYEISKAKMIEIKLGQGALGGMGARIPPEKLKGRAREIMNIKDGEDAIIHEHFFENQTLEDFKELVEDLRKFSKGVPIGVKIGAGGKLEEDLNRIIELDIDFIAVDGGQASTHDSPTIIQDDFGIPTLHAVVRASNYLKARGVKEKISLIVSGGLTTPGDFLKVIAMGADAVYLGSSMLYAISHSQLNKSMPWEPPTQLVWYGGKYEDRFDVEKGAEAGHKFLTACTEEMKVALRAMGKTSLKQLSSTDIVSYDEKTAKYLGIPYSFNTYND
ncbi:FMN-binding glutamate synthase family protein [Bacillus sp. CH30_1T]|uniref:FMN-binding glutamate synthase family protein n=1 Tax=Bacillus sp. CH30_1T TaxID=2604836 RepID=UPI0011EE169C|nr:FMN-binding glutamate synthase family protein [Bacillus sp. CH30_1T]KAA0564660.1 FMN-binding glutamate synthase family protein [Bacillus sp. CH30_1T]